MKGFLWSSQEMERPAAGVAVCIAIKWNFGTAVTFIYKVCLTK